MACDLNRSVSLALLDGLTRRASILSTLRRLQERQRRPAHQLQRAIHCGQVAPERGRRRQELAAISGAHALLTNIMLAWNTSLMDGVVAELRRDGVGIYEGWLRRIGPAHFSHINFRGTLRFNVERYADVLVKRAAGHSQVWPMRTTAMCLRRGCRRWDGHLPFIDD